MLIKKAGGLKHLFKKLKLCLRSNLTKDSGHDVAEFGKKHKLDKHVSFVTVIHTFSSNFI